MATAISDLPTDKPCGQKLLNKYSLQISKKYLERGIFFCKTQVV